MRRCLRADWVAAACRAVVWACSLVAVLLAVGCDASGTAGAGFRGVIAYALPGESATSVVWVLAHGQRRRIGKGSTPVLSPSGSLIAATGGDPPTVLIYGTNGRHVHRIVSATSTFDSPVWSHDSTYVMFSDQDVRQGPDGQEQPGLDVIDAVSGRITCRIVNGIDGTFDPNGTSDRIVYEGATLNDSTHPYVDTISPSCQSPHRLAFGSRPMWGPSGIAYERSLGTLRAGIPGFPSARSQPQVHIEPWLLLPDGDSRSLVPPRLQGVRDLRVVRFLADGRVVLTTETPHSSLYFVNVQTGRVRTVTPRLPPYWGPADISSDGNEILAFHDVPVGAGPDGSPYYAAQGLAIAPALGGPLQIFSPRGLYASWNQ